ncbi:unnamed protein product, partial [marine sediment metagenome]
SLTKPVHFGKVWIDRERGVALRVEYYESDPTSEQARLACRIESIKHHQLPNDGWVPVEGTRSLHGLDNNKVLSGHIVIDADTITIRREDIPESLFTITFPEGARVHNAITGQTPKAKCQKR